MTAELRIGVIGCGRMGIRRATTTAAHPATTLVAVADADPSRTESLAANLGCHAATVHEVLTSVDIDTVFVCTPNHLHAEMSIAAMANGKHVICEKPMACTPDEADAMIAMARRSAVSLKVGANLRQFANVRAAYQLLQDGHIGEPLSMRGWIGNDGWPAKKWFGDPAFSGGGTVLDNGCHLFDLARWFLGDMSTCTGTTSALYWGLAVEDHGVGVFTTERGLPAVLESSWTEWTTYFAVDLHGTDGVLTIDNRLPAERTVLVARGGTVEVFDFASRRADSYALELDAYVRNRLAGVAPQPDGTDGMRVVEMATAVYRSARAGRAVDVAYRDRRQSARDRVR